MNRHWDSFAEELDWFVRGRHIAVGQLQPPGTWQASPELARRFCTLYRLLSRANLTHVQIDGEPLVLFSWELSSGDCRAWLARQPEPEPAPDLLPSHRALLRAFGGVVERSNEPEGSWLLNINEALTAKQAACDASFVTDYAWAFEEAGGIPVDLPAYYAIAQEANGNTTLCHRTDGDVLLFAPDHDFQHVEPLEGCPEYTLYRVQGAPTLETWVEKVAQQWGGPS